MEVKRAQGKRGRPDHETSWWKKAPAQGTDNVEKARSIFNPDTIFLAFCLAIMVVLGVMGLVWLMR